MDYLDANLKNNICTFLEKFYIDQYNLAEKMTDWTSEALFRSGAGVSFILPEGTLTKMVSVLSSDVAVENFKQHPEQFFTVQNYENLRSLNIYSSDFATLIHC